jgi:hypothetical protein
MYDGAATSCDRTSPNFRAFRPELDSQPDPDRDVHALRHQVDRRIVEVEVHADAWQIDGEPRTQRCDMGDAVSHRRRDPHKAMRLRTLVARRVLRLFRMAEKRRSPACQRTPDRGESVSVRVVR